MTADVCREVGPRPRTPTARLTACVPVQRETVSPGRSAMTDSLPGTIASGPPVLLTYRIQLLNAAGRSAGESAEAGFAAGGDAPAALEALRVSSREAGAVLEWKRLAVPDAPDSTTGTDLVELDRLDLTAPASVAKTKSGSGGAKATGGKTKTGSTGAQSHADLSQDQPNEVRLRVPAGVGTSGASGTLDQSIQMGETYRYTAELVRTVTVGTHVLEMRSAPSNTVQIVRTDSFPPAVPAGLAAIPAERGEGTGAKVQMVVDLSWEPNGEIDLAGYLVSRQLLDGQRRPVGEVQRLNETPLAAPAFRDLSAVAGQGYQYRVTAVDRSGNQSAPSEPVSVTVTP